MNQPSKRKRFYYLSALFSLPFIVLVSCEAEDQESSKSPEFEHLQTFNGEGIRQLIPTRDGGFAAIVQAEDYVVLRLNQDLEVLWKKTFGGSGKDYAESIIQTQDGGFAVIGRSESSDGDVTANNGSYDIWLCKLTASGDLVWNKNYGGSGFEGVSQHNSFLETATGDIYFTGNTASRDGDIGENNGRSDIWFVKIDRDGEIDLEKTYGGSHDDYGQKIMPIGSNFLISVVVRSSSENFNKPGIWVMEIDKTGKIIWKTAVEGLNSGFINVTSSEEVVAVNTSATAFLLSKIDRSGTITAKTFIDFQSVSGKQPFANKVLPTSDGGFLITGDLGGGNEQDALVFRTDSKLNRVYHKIFSGNSLDKSASIFPYNTNSFIYQILTASESFEGINMEGSLSAAVFQLNER